MRASLVLVSCALIAFTSRTVHAENIAIESYTGERPASAPQVLAPLIDELSLRGYVIGDTLGRKFDARVSRPATTKEGLPPTFETDMERGHRLWVQGEFDESIRVLKPAIDRAHADVAVISKNQPLREKLLRGLAALALSHFRKGDVASAKDTFREILRSFPSAEIPRAVYGADANKLFTEVTREVGAGGRGRLIVRSPSDQSVIFVNEQFVNVGTTVTKPDLIPGEYRVFSQLGANTSRMHRVVVTANEETTLQIDESFDSALRTTGWAGFAFRTAAQREQSEAEYARRFAERLQSTSVVVVGIDAIRKRPSIIGALIDRSTGREIRRASVALDPPPSQDRLRTLARFLAGEESMVGLDVQIGITSSEPVKNDVVAPPPGRWMRRAGIGAIGAGLVGGGLSVKFFLDGRAARDDIARVCAVMCTSEQFKSLESKEQTAKRNAIIAGVAGGVAITGGVVLLLLSRSKHEPAPVALSVTDSGAFVRFDGAF